MVRSQLQEIICFYNFLFLVSLSATKLPYPDAGKISLTSIYDATMSAIHPIVTAGSNRCESLKSFLGITYEQMQEKNKTNFHEILDIDWVTKNGNRKFNLTASKRIKRLITNSQKMVILVHGFLESSEGWMVQAVAPELLKKSEYKVFALDGRRIINWEYFRSSTYIRFMGELLGTFLGNIIQNGQDPSKIYVIGHSLGSHIAGVAGKKVQELTGQLLGRITGLDPAGPCFTNVSASGRLDRSDAEYVDIIHSNSGILGLHYPVGHKDFYPNGGSSQPGCYTSICDHSRAWAYFAESITSPRNFPALRCENWTMFEQDLCSGSDVSYMGVQSESGNPGLYYLRTKNAAPFGMGSINTG